MYNFIKTDLIIKMSLLKHEMNLTSSATVLCMFFFLQMNKGDSQIKKPTEFDGYLIKSVYNTYKVYGGK